MMKFAVGALLGASLMIAPALAAPAAKMTPKPAPKTAPAPIDPELMRPIRQFLDGINAGKTDIAFAAFIHGDITIVDEVAPFSWTGPDAPQAWLKAYAAESASQSEAHVQYGRPARAEVEGTSAYLIVPTRYTYKENGVLMMEEAQMTYVLARDDAGWKIQGWTWSGVKPHPAR